MKTPCEQGIYVVIAHFAPYSEYMTPSLRLPRYSRLTTITLIVVGLFILALFLLPAKASTFSTDRADLNDGKAFNLVNTNFEGDFAVFQKPANETSNEINPSSENAVCEATTLAGSLEYPAEISSPGSKIVWLNISNEAETEVQLFFNNKFCLSETFHPMGSQAMWMPFTAKTPILEAGLIQLKIGSTKNGTKISDVIILDTGSTCIPNGDGMNCLAQSTVQPEKSAKLSNVQNATTITNQSASKSSGLWSDPKTWNSGKVPKITDKVLITSGTTVTLDSSIQVSRLQIDPTASLTLKGDTSIELKSKGNIVVFGNLNMVPNNSGIKHNITFIDIDETKFVGGGMAILETDVGLWVKDAGILNAVGAEKTTWVNAKSNINAGATSVTLQQTPIGWLPGDNLVFTPTQAPTVGKSSWDGYFETKIQSIVGNTVTLTSPAPHDFPMVNNKWTTEVLNTSRNVKIQGTGDGSENTETNGRAHIMFLMTSKAQTLKNIELTHLGPRSRHSPDTTLPIMGRYSLHFHHAKDGSRGSLIQGVVTHDTGSHNFVTHASHGITIKDSGTYDSFDESFWWDPGMSESSNDSVWDHNLVAKIQVSYFRSVRALGGFSLGDGSNNKIKNSVVSGVQGNIFSSGFEWPENSVHSPWEFTNNVTHNNKVSGMFLWHNGSTRHEIGRFASYYNGEFGVKHGAYVNSYRYSDSEIYGNGTSGISLLSSSSTDSVHPMLVENLVIDGGGISKYGITIAEHNPQIKLEYTSVIRDNKIRNLGPNGKAIAFIYTWIASGPGDGGTDSHAFGNHREKIKFINNTFDGSQDNLFSLSGYWDDIDKDNKMDWSDVDGDGYITPKDKGEKRGILPNSEIYVALPNGESFQLDSIWQTDPSWKSYPKWNAKRKDITVAGTPIVYAGLDQSVIQDKATVDLKAVSNTNGTINSATTVYKWKMLSGPENVSFTSPNDFFTSASFNKPGKYVLEVSATQGGKTARDQVSVFVNPKNSTLTPLFVKDSLKSWPSPWSFKYSKGPNPGLSQSNNMGTITGLSADTTAIGVNTLETSRDSETTVKVNLNTASFRAGLVARLNDYSPDNYYGATVTSGTGAADRTRIFKVINGTSYDLAVDESWLTAKEVWMKFKVGENNDGSTFLKLKVWPANQTEPNTWTLDVPSVFESRLQGVSGRNGVIGIPKLSNKSATYSSYSSKTVVSESRFQNIGFQDIHSSMRPLPLGNYSSVEAPVTNVDDPEPPIVVDTPPEQPKTQEQIDAENFLIIIFWLANLFS